MANTAIPVRLRYWGDDWTDRAAREREAGYGIIARTCIRTERPVYPCARDGLVVYPVGEFWTTLCSPELDTAISAGECVGLGQWASYDMEAALASYAQTTLVMRDCWRKAGQPDMEKWSKSLGVSIVGKFAQQLRHWDSAPDPGGHERWDVWTHVDREGHAQQYRSLADQVERETRGGETAYSCPAIAAWIYAHGRHQLWYAQSCAGRENVLYCHTDSLFTNRDGVNRLCAAGIVGTGQTGLLRVVDVWREIEILGIAHYRAGGRTVCAGMAGSGLGGAPALGADWFPERVLASLTGHHPPRPVERRGPGETLQPYRHGIRESDGRVSPWRIGS